jgi:hypothetical protein
MTDPLTALVQRCYDDAVATKRPTRSIAERLVSEAPADLVAEMAVEYLVSVVAREQRAATLEAERDAERRTSAVAHEGLRIPRKGTRERELWEIHDPRGREWAAREAAADARETQMFHGVIKYALDRYADDLRIKWTAELLDSTFTLRDGTAVTWGDASIEQHEARRQMFLDNAHANMEGATRHEVALRELRESGAATLRAMLEHAA